jgi:hypothetical protein
MDEIKKVAALFFGLTPTPRIPKDEDFEVLHPKGNEELSQGLKINWENYIGGESKVARLTPLDIMKLRGMKNTKENYKKAVEILLSLAARHSLPVVRIGEKYLLINENVRR